MWMWQFTGSSMVVECITMRPSVTVITENRWQLLFWEHILLFHQQDMHSLMLSYNRYLMNVRGIKTISQDIPAWESVRIRCLFIVTGLSFFFSVFIFQILLLVTQVFCKKWEILPPQLDSGGIWHRWVWLGLLEDEELLGHSVGRGWLYQAIPRPGTLWCWIIC